MKSNKEHYKDIILNIIEKHVPNAKIILYGSRARKDHKEGSDIDIALDLDLGKKIDRIKIINILDDLDESLLPIEYDVVDFNNVSEDMQSEILKDGVVWKS